MIGYYLEHYDTAQRIQELFHHVRDISKLLTTIIYKSSSPTPFIKLRSTLHIFFDHFFLLEELRRVWLSESTLGAVQHIYNYLHQLLKNDEEYQEDINYIRDGYDEDIDHLRKLVYHSDELLLQYQQALTASTGISNIKIKFILNQGYFF